MKISLNFISFFLIIFSSKQVNTFRCGTDNLKIHPYNIKPTEEAERRRLAAEYQPIKIYADYSNLQRPSSVSSQNYQNILKMIQETLDEFKKFLLVQHIDIDLSESLSEIKESCEVEEVGNDYANFLKDNDLVIFPSFYSQGESVIASAVFCLTYGQRPVGGVLHINPNAIFEKKNNDIYMKNILLHEITHILVFHPYLFSHYGLMEQRNSVYYITSPKALLKARQHFNCPSLTGIALENQGGSGSVGSHWESRYFLGDYMISHDYYDVVISDITLALFEDSGNYKVNYYSGGLFKFGKNEGCDFLNKKCIENGALLSREFCISPRDPICSSSRQTKGYCLIYDYSLYGETIPSQYQYFDNPNYGGFYPVDFCPVPDSYNNDEEYYSDSCKIGSSSLDSEFGEKIGENSFCFLSTLLPASSSTTISETQGICYEVRCDSSNKRIIISIGSQTITCPTSGGNINNPSGFKGTITCPKYIDICSFKDNVMCSGLYDCLDKKVGSDPDSYTYDPDDENFIRVDASKHLQFNYFIFYMLFILFILYN